MTGANGGRPVPPGAHRTLVFCADDAPNVYAKAYGWWCLDCPEIRDADTNPTSKANAERDAGRHRDRAGSRFRNTRTAPLMGRQSA